MANDDLLRALKNAVKTGDEVYCKNGTILSVDKTFKTCVVSPIDGSPDFFDVRLQGFEGAGVGFVVYPKVGSIVALGFLSKEEALIIQTSEVDKITIENDSESLKTILSDLMEKIEALTEKVSEITVMTPVGASGVPLNATEILQVKTDLEAIKQRLPNLFE